MTNDEFQAELDKNKAAQQGEQDKQAQISAINKAGIKNVEATNANTKSTAEALKNVRGTVTVDNPDLAKTQDVSEAIDAIHKLNLTTFMSNPSYHDMANTMQQLIGTVETLQEKMKNEGMTAVSNTLTTLVTKMEAIAKQQASTKIGVDSSFVKTLSNLQKSIDAIDFKPSVNVQAPDSKVIQTPVDLKPIMAGLSAVEQAIKDAQTDDDKEDKLDLQPVIEGLGAVQTAITSIRFPVANYVLPFLNSKGEAAQVQLDSSGNVPVTGGGGGSGGTQYQELATTSPATGTLSLGRYVSSLPTLTNGQMNEPLLDSSSRLLTTETNSSTIATNTGNSATAANQTNGNQKAQLYDAVSGLAPGVVAGDTGFNGVATASATKTYTFTTSTSGAQTLLANTPTEGFSYITIITTSVGSGLAWAGQFSATSGGTYIATNHWIDLTSAAAAPGSITTTTNKIETTPIVGNYFQLSVNALTSGTLSGYIILSNSPISPTAATATQSGTWTVGSNSATGSAVPANAFYMGLNSSGSTLTGWQSMNGLGDSQTGISTAATGVNIFNGTNYDRTRSANAAAGTTGTGLLGAGVLGYDGTDWQYAGITKGTNAIAMTQALKNAAVAVSSSATVVKSSAGYLSGVLVSVAGTTTAMTFYDNASAASGTVIGYIPSTATAGSYWPFNMPAANGITCSGSSTNPAVTVAYS